MKIKRIAHIYRRWLGNHNTRVPGDCRRGLCGAGERGSMVLIGRGFVVASEKKNQAEAEYRYVLTRLRENGEFC